MAAILVFALRVIAAVPGSAGIVSSLFSAKYLPHRYCYLAQPGLVWTNAVTDAVIAVSYCTIFVCLLLVVRKLRRIPEMRPYLWILLSFGAFIIACAGTHLMDVVTVWWPLYPLAAAVKVLCAAVSIPTALYFAITSPSIDLGIHAFLNSRVAASQANAAKARDAEAKLRIIMENVLAGIIMIDSTGSILSVNPAGVRMFEYTLEEVVGRNLKMLMPEPDRSSHDGHLAGYMSTSASLVIGHGRELEGLTKTGRTFPIELTVTEAIFEQSRIFIGLVRDISERKRAAEAAQKAQTALLAERAALQEANARALLAAESADIGIWEQDLSTGQIKCDAWLCRLYGLDAADVRDVDPKFWEERLHAEDRQRVSEALQISIDRLQPFSCEFRIIHGDGKVRFLYASGIVQFEAEGKPLRLVGTSRDVTARKESEAERSRQVLALRQSEELLDRTGRMAGVGGWEIDLVHHSVHWTDETARLHGLAPGYQPTLEEGIDFYVPTFRPAVLAAIEKATLDGQPWELEAQVTRVDGSLMWAMVKGSVEFVNGRAVRMIGAFQDVTARKVAEEELRYQANLLDLSHDTIMVRDVDGRIRFWNRGAQETYGYTKEQAVGHISHSLLRTVFSTPLAEIDAELRANGRWEGELGHSTRSGELIVVASRWVLQQDQNGDTFNVLETNNDITERKRAEEISRKATVEAEEANRAKSEFLANMSHEIRTPMNAIMGMTHLALRANPTREQGAYLKKIGSAADSLLNVINDILDFSKMEAGKMELENIVFSVEKVLLDLNDIVSHTAKRRNIAVKFSIGKEVPAFLTGDPLRLGQILINLVNNGIKFTREGSVSITVAATAVTDTTADVTFAVADTGIGMSEGQLAKLFLSFNQADPSVTRNFGGTGLGLAISKQLCELMGGTIGVRSNEGQGSTFTLQAQFGIAAGSQLIQDGKEKADKSRKFVLVVDDSADARDVLVAMLTANGFDARSVSAGEEVLAALESASKRDKPFDLVLMDWRMPGINGLEIARQIKAQLELFHIPSIVMVSAFEREEVMYGVTDPGLEGFLVKPVKESVLIETVRGLLKGQDGTNEDRALFSRLRRSAARPEDLAGRRVLLVEDNEINRDLATELLNDLGIVVSVAVEGREGVDRVAAEPFDLVLMDIQMPVMDGLTATRLIRSDARFHALPIIAMTAHAMSGDREKSLAAGMNDHLTKPISPDSLTDILLRWMPERLDVLPPPLEAAAVEAVDDSLPAELLPFNLQAALVRTNGKPKLLRKMMLSFRQQYAGAGSDLRLLLGNGKNEEAERLAHSLKSVACTLEADALGVAAGSIELALRTGSMLHLETLIDLMEQTLTPAIAAAATLDRREQAVETIAAPHAKSESTILVVDDDPAYVELLKDIFSKEHSVISVTHGRDVVAIATATLPDVILMDVMMPDMDGYEVFDLLKRERLTCDIPLIFLTGLGDVADESKALAMGAVDYVTKPINPLAVRARVNHQIKLKRAHDQLMQHATEDLLVQLRKEAERAAETERINKQELELRDHFLSHVSHELRSPLTAIYLFSTLIADGLAGATTPQQDEYLGYIGKNISQLKAMIEDLLLVTAAKTGKLEAHAQAVALKPVVDDAVHTLQGPSAMKSVALSSMVSADLMAYADPIRLLQILIILVDNAIKFTPPGGSVGIEARPLPSDPDFLIVEVSDTGCGIAPGMTERIFEHLYQISDVSDAGRNGLGLGLHIARELVTLQGGRIWAEPLPAAGSRFSFTVPVRPKDKVMHDGEAPVDEMKGTFAQPIEEA